MKKLLPLWLLIIIMLISQPNFSQSWTTPEIVHDNLKDHKREFSFLTMAIGNDETIHFVWATGSRPYNYDLKDSLYYFQKRGAELLPPLSFSRDVNAKIADVVLILDQNQTPHILWGERKYLTVRPSHKIYYSRIENRQWLTPILITEIDSSFYSICYNIKLLYLPDQALLAYWFGPDATIWFSYYDREQWSVPFMPFPSYNKNSGSLHGGWAYYPDICLGSDSKLHVAFIGDDGKSGAYLLRRINYVTNDFSNRDWAKTVPQCIFYSYGSFYYDIQLAISNEGTRYVIWLSDPDRNAFADDVYYCYSKDGEHWSIPKNLSNQGEWNPEAHLAVDQSGIAHVLWLHLVNNKGKLERHWYYIPVQDDAWAEPEEIQQMNYLLSPGNCNFIIDPQNREHLAWKEKKEASDTSDYVIKYMWRDLPTQVIERRLSESQIGLDSNIRVRAYPNPFNETTILTIEVSTPARLTLSIYNINGQLVTTLFQDSLVASRIQLSWAGTDDRGRRVPSGVYMYVVRSDNTSFTNSQIETGKLVLLK